MKVSYDLNIESGEEELDMEYDLVVVNKNWSQF